MNFKTSPTEDYFLEARRLATEDFQAIMLLNNRIALTVQEVGWLRDGRGLHYIDTIPNERGATVAFPCELWSMGQYKAVAWASIFPDRGMSEYDQWLLEDSWRAMVQAATDELKKHDVSVWHDGFVSLPSSAVEGKSYSELSTSLRRLIDDCLIGIIEQYRDEALLFLEVAYETAQGEY